MPVYLLDGEAPVLFEAPLACLARLYEREIKHVLGNRTPAYLFLTHSHFDHISAAGHLKKVWPKMKIAASSRVAEILTRPSAVDLIRTLNQKTAELVKQWGTIQPSDEGFEPFTLDLELEPEQRINLGGGRVVQALATPGHTWDFLSYWLPEEKILVASEAAGCADISGYIVTEFLVDYDVYLASLERLSRLDVEIFGQGHHYVYLGPEARERIRQAQEQAGKYLAMVERFLREEGGDLDRAAARVKAFEWDPKPLPKQSETAYMLNTMARVRTVRERMNRGRP
ncbi:MAG: MBL fold metallo-hydrolase [Thermodesulfobacteriota bacterium]